MCLVYRPTYKGIGHFVGRERLTRTCFVVEQAEYGLGIGLFGCRETLAKLFWCAAKAVIAHLFVYQHGGILHRLGVSGLCVALQFHQFDDASFPGIEVCQQCSACSFRCRLLVGNGRSVHLTQLVVGGQHVESLCGVVDGRVYHVHSRRSGVFLNHIRVLGDNRVVETLRQKEVTKAQAKLCLPQVVVAAVVGKVLCQVDIVHNHVRCKDDVVEFFPRFVLANNPSWVPAAYLHVILQRVGKHSHGGKRVVVGYVDVDKVFNRGGGRVHSCLVVE